MDDCLFGRQEMDLPMAQCGVKEQRCETEMYCSQWFHYECLYKRRGVTQKQIESLRFDPEQFPTLYCPNCSRSAHCNEHKRLACDQCDNSDCHARPRVLTVKRTRGNTWNDNASPVAENSKAAQGTEDISLHLLVVTEEAAKDSIAVSNLSSNNTEYVNASHLDFAAENKLLRRLAGRFAKMKTLRAALKRQKTMIRDLQTKLKTQGQQTIHLQKTATRAVEQGKQYQRTFQTMIRSKNSEITNLKMHISNLKEQNRVSKL